MVESAARQLARPLREVSDHRRRGRRSVFGSRTVRDGFPRQRSVPSFVNRRHGSAQQRQAVGGRWRPNEQSPPVRSGRFPAPDQRFQKPAEPTFGSLDIIAFAQAQMPRIIALLGRCPESRLVGRRDGAGEA